MWTDAAAVRVEPSVTAFRVLGKKGENVYKMGIKIKMQKGGASLIDIQGDKNQEVNTVGIKKSFLGQKTDRKSFHRTMAKGGHFK